jgi:uncharacterized protein involved in exopolysaccharide biosynthesis
MAVTESERRLVFEKLEQSIGERAADLIMNMLPYQAHDELATRSDMAATTTMLRSEMSQLRAELRGEMAELRGEMAELRAELRGEMAELRAEVRQEIAGLQRWMAGVVAANAIAVITVLVT